MASPCEVLIETSSRKLAKRLGKIARDEAFRIEHAFSRYRDDNIVHKINHSGGARVEVDQETARLLDFADQCFTLSDGLFDITSGVLGQVWRFDGSDNIPPESAVNKLLNLVGWEKVNWQSPFVALPQDMQIDFGGIGKEYAVDRTVALLREATDLPFLVNFGGDLHAGCAPNKQSAWVVGIEAMRSSGIAVKTIELKRGALTTSGDAQRFLLKDGIRFGHVLHPKTGWPVLDAPASVTVAGNSCTESGVLSTLALLHGAKAESFLKSHNVDFWCQR
ncbi:MAG: FAD:protein FMN transferase [Gammaproteobacteria bacterium]|nr:FAD:protein FMN transferase [Gammaproteobacteria bacterium]